MGFTQEAALDFCERMEQSIETAYHYGKVYNAEED
jgi:hypothetical protein